jgi:hypothetical protein
MVQISDKWSVLLCHAGDGCLFWHYSYRLSRTLARISFAVPVLATVPPQSLLRRRCAKPATAVIMPDKRCEFLGIIMNECKRVDAILSELDACTEIIPLACRPTDASSMLGEVIRLAAMEHPDPAISLRIEVAPDLPQRWCDPIRIQQTIVPFVTGLTLGMPGGGEILLAANRQNGHARIQLRVLGQTLRSSDPAEGRGAYSSTFDAPGGVRILAARRTVLQHGGTITLDQTGPLKKMVSLTLPLYHGQKP